MKCFSLLLIVLLISFAARASVAPITGSLRLCVGYNTALRDSTSGGSWSSSNLSVATIDPAGHVFGVSPGTTAITYTVDTAHVTVIGTINALPGIYTVTGGGNICAGRATLVGLSGSDTGVMYGLYSSTGSAGGGVFLGTGAAFNFGYVTTSGVYTVLATNAAGCHIEMGSIVITVNPLPPVITGPATVCAGAEITLSDSATGGTWSAHSLSVFTVSSGSGVVTGVSGGAALVSYTLPDGCIRTTGITVTPMPLPVVTYNPATNTLYATPGYESYQWYDSLIGIIPGAITATLAVAATEYYYVVVANSNGCERSSALYYFNTNQLGIEPVGAGNKVNIYPNPVQNILTITAAGIINQVTIHNLLGQTVYTHAYSTTQAEADVADLPAGMYFVNVNDTAAGKFVKK